MGGLGGGEGDDQQAVLYEGGRAVTPARCGLQVTHYNCTLQSSSCGVLGGGL